MPNLKDVATMVLVVVLLASLGYWYIELPIYLAEKKRRQREINRKEAIDLFGWEWTARERDMQAGGKPCKYHIYVRMWDGRVIEYELVFNSHRDFYTWVGGMYSSAIEKIDRIDYSREVLDA